MNWRASSVGRPQTAGLGWRVFRMSNSSSSFLILAANWADRCCTLGSFRRALLGWTTTSSQIISSFFFMLSRTIVNSLSSLLLSSKSWPIWKSSALVFPLARVPAKASLEMFKYFRWNNCYYFQQMQEHQVAVYRTDKHFGPQPLNMPTVQQGQCKYQ